MNTLFGNIAPAQPLTRTERLRAEVERKKRIVFDRQCKIWKQEVIRFAIKEFLPQQTERFLAEKLREAYGVYAKLSGLPPTVQGKAFNGIMNELLRRKLIVTCEPIRREINGVWATSYKKT